MLKICAKCLIEKSWDCFYKSGGKPRSYCIDCYKTYNQEQRIRHNDKRRAYDRKRRPHGSRVGNYDANASRRWKYKITAEAYEAMFVRQGGKCAICQKVETDKYQNGVRDLAVDHDHKTGKIRGLLCGKCNKALGLFQDSIELLEAATLYMKDGVSS